MQGVWKAKLMGSMLAQSCIDSNNHTVTEGQRSHEWHQIMTERPMGEWVTYFWAAQKIIVLKSHNLVDF